jgi:RNA polymerase sigma-70 factor (ECF subfamily)
MDTGDLALAQAAARGEGKARRRLADRLLDRVRATIGYLTGGDQELDDMVQLAMVEIIRSAHTFRGEGPLVAWADRIAVRTAMRMLRKRSGQEKVAAGPDICAVADARLADQGKNAETLNCPVFPTAAECQEQRMMRMQLRKRLALHLQKLGEAQRTAVVLRWVYGYKLKEIAALTDTPVNTVRDRLQTGRKKLLKIVARDPVLQDWQPGRAHA